MIYRRMKFPNVDISLLNLDQVKDFETGLLEHFQSKYSDSLDEIHETGDIGEDLEKKMDGAIEEFKKTF